MKIDTRCLPEGEQVSLSESESIEGLDTTGIRVISPLEIRADIIKIQDTLDIKLDVGANFIIQCSRCLEGTETVIRKKFRLDYSITEQEEIIDITGDIRQEIILDYPLKSLCKVSCKGLCPSCGKNLNEGPCGCK